MSDLGFSATLSNAQARALPAGIQSKALSNGSLSTIEKNARDFESVFLNTMLQQMFTGIEDGGAWGGGTGSDAWQGLLIDEYSKAIAGAGGIGIADAVKRELIALQEIN
ncbi:rod-binding protein [Stappia sp. F7233]|uniref:Rod-binding protein n=1 Tax=Stappia albiluteola TaxID=2758565 RepID=A0A839ALJ2_9HYPH|nr:rod-binding protein [Stappia albiluteola]MBA5779309.1 rod-binding protein [Stappia albiluteola]